MHEGKGIDILVGHLKHPPLFAHNFHKVLQHMGILNGLKSIENIGQQLFLAIELSHHFFVLPAPGHLHILDHERLCR